MSKYEYRGYAITKENDGGYWVVNLGQTFSTYEEACVAIDQHMDKDRSVRRGIRP